MHRTTQLLEKKSPFIIVFFAIEQNIRQRKLEKEPIKPCLPKTGEAINCQFLYFSKGPHAGGHSTPLWTHITESTDRGIQL